MASQLDPVHRLLPKRFWTQSNGISLILWTLFGTCFLGILLISTTLFVDLLVTRGLLSPDDPLINKDLLPEDLPREISVGLWAQAARFGNLPFWSWLPGLCAAFPFAESPFASLAVVALVGLMSWLVLVAAFDRAKLQASSASRETATWLRKSIHRQTLRLGPSDFTGQRYQLALRLFTDEVDAIREAIVNCRWRLVRAWIVLPALLLAIVAIDWRLGLQCLIPALACWAIYRYEQRKAAKEQQLSEAHAETEVRFLAEGLKQTRLVRGYNMEDFEQVIFEKHLARMTTEQSASKKAERLALATAKLVSRLGMAVILLLIAIKVISPASTLPVASGITLLLALVGVAFELASVDKWLTYRAQLALDGDRVYRYLDEIPEVGQAVGAKFVEPVSKSIVFESVHYQQQGHEILRGIDLRIEAKSQVALVSLDPWLPKALVHLLPRFIEPTKGRVLFDGEDIAWGTLESIRAEVAYIGSDDPFLTGTVLENLICGDPRYSLQDAVEAAKHVHAHQAISALPQGYETVLGEHGERLNAGDAFRVGLARAILRNPAVMIIEEPDQILDDNTKALIDDAYQRISENRTVIFLPSRLSTIRRCDQVIMLHEGKVDAIGAHSKLAKSSELYRHWDYLTFNSFSRRLRRLSSTNT